MRKLIVLLAAAGLLLGISGTAQAGVFEEATSTLQLNLGGLPGVPVVAQPGTQSLVALTDQLAAPFGHQLVVSSTVWSTQNFGPGTALFTGVPLVSNLKVTVTNQAGTLADGFTVGQNTASAPNNVIGGGVPIANVFGGVLRLSGQTVLFSLNGLIQLPTPLALVGGNMGATTTAMSTAGPIPISITATNGPFITAPWIITGVTSNILTIPARPAQGVGFTLQPTSMEESFVLSTNGGFLETTAMGDGLPVESHTVTITGTNSLLSAAPSQAGSVTVVAPIRIQTGAIAGVIPGSAVMAFQFVPEPGTVLLLVSGAIGLAVIGRRRMRK